MTIALISKACYGQYRPLTKVIDSFLDCLLSKKSQTKERMKEEDSERKNIGLPIALSVYSTHHEQCVSNKFFSVFFSCLKYVDQLIKMILKYMHAYIHTLFPIAVTNFNE